MAFNPSNGRPSTLCPGCGHWCDWSRQFIHMPDGSRVMRQDKGHKWKKPITCEWCRRQLVDAVNPDRNHLKNRDIPGQQKLL